VSSTPVDNPAVEQLLDESSARRGAPLGGRELTIELVSAAGLVASSVALVAIAGIQRHPEAWLVAGLVILYALVGRARFDIGSGFTAPTELVFVPMAFLVAPALLPVVTAAGLLLLRLPDVARGDVHPLRLLLAGSDAWYAVGPAIVLALAGGPQPSVAQVGLLAAVVGAQLLFDTIASVARESAILAVAPTLQLRFLGEVFAADLALAPVAFAVACVMPGHEYALLAVLPLAALLMVFSRERDLRIEHALQLSGAYRGTAMLMGDVLEADDAYTGGEHSQGVVTLALAVGRELALDAREQRDLEVGALLHDIGKLNIPNSIINKPGKLTDEEWEIVRRHPADGQRMLERVGGRLMEVGRIVRAHHERMDGRGYPDGLIGEEIPLAARIICACDAYSAMTTTRSYRPAMTNDDAVAELLRCTPDQFDPKVVGALLNVTRADRSEGPQAPVLDAVLG
jgi:HD-GYP domain-containing protein (c-di-GMP phosphodiesterase class II)